MRIFRRADYQLCCRVTLLCDADVGRVQQQAALEGRRFAFSVLVHTDVSSAMVDFLNASSVLQVSSEDEGQGPGQGSGSRQSWVQVVAESLHRADGGAFR